MRAVLLIGALVVVGPLSLVSAASGLGDPDPDQPPGGPIGDLLGARLRRRHRRTREGGRRGLRRDHQALFSWPAKLVNRELLSWLVAVPDYAIDPSTARPDGRAATWPSSARPRR